METVQAHDSRKPQPPKYRIYSVKTLTLKKLICFLSVSTFVNYLIQKPTL